MTENAWKYSDGGFTSLKKKIKKNILQTENHSVALLNICALENDHGNDYTLRKCFSLSEYRK